MSSVLTTKSPFEPVIERVCQRVAPLWPLRNFVAVNPYVGLADRPFWEAHTFLKQSGGAGLAMDRGYYREKMASGHLREEDLLAVMARYGVKGPVERLLSGIEEQPGGSVVRIVTLSRLASELDGSDWSSFVVERISHFCASFFDEGQSAWKNPWVGESLWSGWLSFARIDKSPVVMGISGYPSLIARLSPDPGQAMEMVLSALDVPETMLESYLFSLLSTIGGWASWTRYQKWQAELKNGDSFYLRDLLAIRLVFEWIFLEGFRDRNISQRWKKEKGALSLSLSGKNPSPQRVFPERLFQEALEMHYEKELVALLSGPETPVPSSERPDFHAVFCIDVRSEVFRRNLESVAPGGRTIGFAGFFGVPLEYVPFGSVEGKSHLPILFSPAYRIQEQPTGTSSDDRKKMGKQRQARLRESTLFKTFKTSAASCFSYVEAFGILSLGKLLGDSLGWSRPVPHPLKKGLSGEGLDRMAPVLDYSVDPETGEQAGIPPSERMRLAEMILQNMGLTRNFSRVVAIVGHGSSTTNNPHGTGLDCGACGGQTGEVSARIAASLLNDGETRKRLADEKGILIPEDTLFIAALHDTTRDQVRIFDWGALPVSHLPDVTRLEKAFREAGLKSMAERADSLGLAGKPPGIILADLEQRAKDWSHVRPEWGLAGNAAFIAAPRSRTRGKNLAGRVFLHDYTWQDDPGFETLKLILTAPLVVANWINMQYYGSMVDNDHYGSGNKVLHNVVGGSVGVLEGNGGDLRCGLSLQSLHDGKRWVHEPIRLLAIVEAPLEPIETIIEEHDLLRNLIDNEWIHLFRIDESGAVRKRMEREVWK